MKRTSMLILIPTLATIGCGEMNGDELGALDHAPMTAALLPPIIPPPATPLPTLAAGARHTCTVYATGPAVQSRKVRCWGYGDSGALGYGNTNEIGNNETPASAGDVNVGGVAVQVAAGEDHTCAILDTGAVRCWGWGYRGRLGYGNETTIGDNEAASSGGDIDLGGRAVQIDAGMEQTCALLDTGSVRCWGAVTVPYDGGFFVTYGVGYGAAIVGDDETPAVMGDVNVGAAVKQIAVGGRHMCAALTNGRVRCWGFGGSGQLGYANTESLGDNANEIPPRNVSVLGDGPVAQVTAGDDHTCALLDTGKVRCWGYGGDGQLGYGNTDNIGDNETPATAGDVNVGGTVAQIAAGSNHTCALLTNGAVRCWGLNDRGQLGYGNSRTIGDNETPASAGDVNVGGTVKSIAAGGKHTCAVMATGAIRCWGFGDYGQLGYGNTSEIGNNETPASAGDVPFR
jgi:alpha-tubulin suppressor-like RCC1 family protein